MGSGFCYTFLLQILHMQDLVRTLDKNGCIQRVSQIAQCPSGNQEHMVSLRSLGPVLCSIFIT